MCTEKKAKISYESFLHLVSKPARYICLEKNVIRKEWDENRVKAALCFPEVYELGMAHLGLKILYHLINQSEHFLAERCFAPWPDMENELRQRNFPLLSLESQTPLSEFDLVGFSLQSELTFTNLLNMLDLGGIPLLGKDRTERDPIVLAGGPVTSNPEPCADFVDAFLIGDGEEAFLDLLHFYREGKAQNKNREEILLGIAKIPGFYVPRFYIERWDKSGAFQGVVPVHDEVPAQVHRRFVKELKIENYPEKPVVAHSPSVQDRHVVEVVRGCTQGCRFCQAGYIYRPIRELSKTDIVELTKGGLENSGYSEVGLVSLSTADYSDFPGMVDEVSSIATPKNVSISLPSLRADSMSVEVADRVRQVKQTGFTFAPEAGSRRLRTVINKNITNEELLESIEMAFQRGWNVIKLYFMVGLPTETYQDLDETIELIQTAERIARKYGGRKKINVSFGPFVPKAHTPFQWDGFFGVDELRQRMLYIKSRVSSKVVHFKWQEPELSHFEAVVSKGNRSVGKGLLLAFQEGLRFEGWSEHFHYDKMMDCLQRASVDIEHWCSEQSLDQILPWDHIDTRIKKKFLSFERKKAFRSEKVTTTDCRWGDCHYCGIPNPKEDIKLKHERPGDLDLERRRSENSGKKIRHRMSESRADALRFRLIYTKVGLARFLSHTDIVRLFQMGMKVAGFPSLYSKGFNPRPVMQFGPVLPLGVESQTEVLDLWLLQSLSQSAIDQLNLYLPHGMRVLKFEQVELQGSSLSVSFPFVRYRATLGNFTQGIENSISRWEENPVLLVEHRGRQIDLKKAIRKLELKDQSLSMEVSISSQDGHNANPLMVMEKLFGISPGLRGDIPLIKEHLLTH